MSGYLVREGMPRREEPVAEMHADRAGCNDPYTTALRSGAKAGRSRHRYRPAATSVQADPLMRTVQGEGGDRDLDPVAALRLHLIGADHHPRRRRQRAAAGVFEAVARPQQRLLADHAGTANLLGAALGVGDRPEARRSEEHTSELQSLMRISYAVF